MICEKCNNSTHFKKHEGVCALDEWILYAFSLAKNIRMPEEAKVKLRKKLVMKKYEG